MEIKRRLHYGQPISASARKVCSTMKDANRRAECKYSEKDKIGSAEKAT